MNQRDHMDHVAELVRLCAETMRTISRSVDPDTSGCPFRHVVRQLEDISDEMKEIASELPDDWRHDPV